MSEANLVQKIQSNNHIDQNTYINNISHAIITAADKSIPNEFVTVKTNDFPCIICYIKILIKKRKVNVYLDNSNKQTHHHLLLDQI